jgi:hypothetical protein
MRPDARTTIPLTLPLSRQESRGVRTNRGLTLDRRGFGREIRESA